jgi:hypothetical protein
MRDIREAILPATVLASADHTTTNQTSASVDMLGFNAVAFFMEVGTITTTGSVKPKLEVSDNDSDWDDAPLTDLISDAGDGNAVPDLVTDTNVRFGYAGISRYVRVATTAVTTTAQTFGIVAVQAEPATTPTSF